MQQPNLRLIGTHPSVPCVITQSYLFVSKFQYIPSLPNLIINYPNMKPAFKSEFVSHNWTRIWSLLIIYIFNHPHFTLEFLFLYFSIWFESLIIFFWKKKKIKSFAMWLKENYVFSFSLIISSSPWVNLGLQWFWRFCKIKMKLKNFYLWIYIYTRKVCFHIFI